MDAALLLSVLFLAMTGHSSVVWCVCKDSAGEANLQKTLDYALEKAKLKAPVIFLALLLSLKLTLALPAMFTPPAPVAVQAYANNSSYINHHAYDDEPKNQHPDRHNTIRLDNTDRSVRRN
ncbi:hypothetical protein V6N11_011313 [Hibiscus sabdariffa]|uniref:Uncharacterized protein n=1 Tax=Hibiscus sabdariffa TaxID=183260 RepID=A0ABR2S7W3_9ROSI